MIKTSTDTMRVAPSGATRHTNDSKPDYRGFLSPRAIRRFGQYLMKHQVQADGQRRASDNWKKGMPIDWYTESLIRHVQDFHFEIEAGSEVAADELACAIWFNVQGYLHEREKVKAAVSVTEISTAVRLAPRRPARRSTRTRRRR